MKIIDPEVNTFQRARWEEVLTHSMVVESVEPDPIDDGMLVMHLDTEDAATWGIYPILSIGHGGTVAEYSVNLPYHYMTLAELLKAAAVRTAAI